jgi:hypothetical protein
MGGAHDKISLEENPRTTSLQLFEAVVAFGNPLLEHARIQPSMLAFNFFCIS